MQLNRGPVSYPKTTTNPITHICFTALGGGGGAMDVTTLVARHEAATNDLDPRPLMLSQLYINSYFTLCLLQCSQCLYQHCAIIPC
jgi:hypothetical protein